MNSNSTRRTGRRSFVGGMAVGVLALVAVVAVSHFIVVSVSTYPSSTDDAVSPLARTVVESLASAFEIPELEAQSRSSAEYRFLPNRRNMWVVNRRLGRLVHYRFLDTSKGTVERSHVAQVDQQRFPTRDTVFKISERNITDLLWIGNRRTGDFQLWRRNVRDGRLVTDPLPVEAAPHLQSALIDSSRP